jgi:hypothetical protein
MSKTVSYEHQATGRLVVFLCLALKSEAVGGLAKTLFYNAE